MRILPILVAAAISMLLMAAAPAAADDRYAEPAGDGPILTCPQSDPCSITDAVDPTATDDGDEVILAPGTYSLDARLQLLDAVHMHGTGVPSDTKIVATYFADNLVYMENAASEISNLEINAVVNAPALSVASGIVNRVIVRNTAGDACAGASVRIIQSVCSSVANEGEGLVVDVSLITTPVNLRNSTITGGPNAYGIRAYSSGAGTANVNMIGVIASGAAGAVFLSGASTTFTATHSNYQSVNAGGVTNFTPAGSGTNQTTLPKFVDQAAGDLRQKFDSITIDAGAVDGLSGTVDLLGAARSQGAAPDIGAYEFDPATAPPPDTPGSNPPGGTPSTPSLLDTVSPTLTITKKPKSKTASKKLVVVFKSSEAATFECKLDKGKFTPCRSPYKRSVKPGKHKLLIKAIDLAGNVSSVKTIKWTVKKP